MNDETTIRTVYAILRETYAATYGADDAEGMFDPDATLVEVIEAAVEYAGLEAYAAGLSGDGRTPEELAAPAVEEYRAQYESEDPDAEEVRIIAEDSALILNAVRAAYTAGLAARRK